MTVVAPSNPLRPDLRLIADMVVPGSRVLDVGCADGMLLAYLVAEKDVDGRGLEIDHRRVQLCLEKGLSVVQGAADTDLDDYPTGAFDYAILSKTLQATHRPAGVLDSLLRIADKAIVSFPNFGHWRVRGRLAVTGRMPVTGTLRHPWHATPNIHLCTVKDFIDLARDMDLAIERFVPVSDRGKRQVWTALRVANLLADSAIFLVSRKT